MQRLKSDKGVKSAPNPNSSCRGSPIAYQDKLIAKSVCTDTEALLNTLEYRVRGNRFLIFFNYGTPNQKIWEELRLIVLIIRTYAKNINVVPQLLQYKISIFRHFLRFFCCNSGFQFKNLKYFFNMCLLIWSVSDFFQNLVCPKMGDIEQKQDFCFFRLNYLPVELKGWYLVQIDSSW